MNESASCGRSHRFFHDDLIRVIVNLRHSESLYQGPNPSRCFEFTLKISSIDAGQINCKRELEHKFDTRDAEFQVVLSLFVYKIIHKQSSSVYLFPSIKEGNIMFLDSITFLDAGKQIYTRKVI